MENRILTGWLALILIASLFGLAFSGCNPDDDDDSGDYDDDDDDDNWQDNPEIVVKGDEALSNLTEAAKDALEVGPSWLYGDLVVAFTDLSDEVQDKLAGLILNAADDRYLDEIAFCAAHLSLSDLAYPSLHFDLIEENAALIYQADEILDYVTIVEYGDAKSGGDYYSTLKYEMPDGPVEIDREIYYWYVVHPRLEDERPTHINPENGSPVDPPEGVFWREYLMNHADDECPGKAECPLLSQMLSEEEFLWSGLNDAPDNGAIGAITRWVNVSMIFDAGSVRPIQPVRIYAIHMGRCGEHADLTSAAGRAALIPTVNAAAYADDHTWNEFYDGQWHEWEPVNGYIDEPDHYDQWGGGGPGINGVYATRGDGFTWNITPTYTDTCTIEVTVTDEEDRPVEGARVTSQTMAYGRYITSFAAWTDAQGQATALLGDEKQHYYLQATSPLGKYPEGDPEHVVKGSVTDEVYVWEAELPDSLISLEATQELGLPTSGPYEVEVAVELTTGYLNGSGIVSSLDFLDNSYEAKVRLLVLNKEQYELYDAGDPFEAYFSRVVGSESVTFSIPDPGPWYVVISNEESVSVTQLGDFSVAIRRSGAEEVLVSETIYSLLAPGDRLLFGLAGF